MIHEMSGKTKNGHKSENDDDDDDVQNAFNSALNFAEPRGRICQAQASPR
jgi:hypothetical protein